MKYLYRFLPLLLLSACGQKESIPYETLAWVNNFYVERPVSSLSATAGGWLFRGAREYGDELRVGFLVPDAIDGNARQRRAIINMVCPAKSEKIWSIMPSQFDLVVTVFTKDNKFKDSVTC